MIGSLVSPRKLKAPAAAVPSASRITPQIVACFAAHQAEVRQWTQMLSTQDCAKLIMTSPFLSFITYSLLDSFRIIAVHDRRHFEQALRVTQTPGFPQ